MHSTQLFQYSFSYLIAFLIIYLQKSHKHQRFNHYLLKPTTFFPEFDIPVKMSDPDDVPGPSTSSSTHSLTSISQSNYLLPNNYHEEFAKLSTKTNEELQLELLKRIRIEKQREYASVEEPFLHHGFKV